RPSMITITTRRIGVSFATNQEPWFSRFLVPGMRIGIGPSPMFYFMINARSLLHFGMEDHCPCRLETGRGVKGKLPSDKMDIGDWVSTIILAVVLLAILAGTYPSLIQQANTFKNATGGN